MRVSLLGCFHFRGIVLLLFLLLLSSPDLAVALAPPVAPALAPALAPEP